MATWWSDPNITSQNEKFTLSEDMALRGGWAFKISYQNSARFSVVDQTEDSLFFCVCIGVETHLHEHVCGGREHSPVSFSLQVPLFWRQSLSLAYRSPNILLYLARKPQ